MPSVSVPLKGEPGWKELCTRRRKFWYEAKNNQLSRNFKSTEFWTHDGSPAPISARPAMVRLCRDFLEPLRAKFGEALVLSGYRHELYNQQIGGARFSQHVYENNFESVAADMRFKRGTPALWAAEARKLRTKHGGDGGIGTYPRQGFCHFDNRSYKADWSGMSDFLDVYLVEMRIRVDGEPDEIGFMVHTTDEHAANVCAMVHAMTLAELGLGIDELQTIASSC